MGTLLSIFRDRKIKLLYDTVLDKFTIVKADGTSRDMDLSAANASKLDLLSLGAGLSLGTAGAKIQLAHVTVGDDAVAAITPIASVGLVAVFGFDATNAANFILASFKAGTSPYITKIAATATIADVGTTDLTGTVGTDTHFTLAAIAAGTLKLENRLGASRNFSYLIIGE